MHLGQPLVRLGVRRKGETYVAKSNGHIQVYLHTCDRRSRQVCPVYETDGIEPSRDIDQSPVDSSDKFSLFGGREQRVGSSIGTLAGSLDEAMFEPGLVLHVRYVLASHDQWPIHESVDDQPA